MSFSKTIHYFPAIAFLAIALLPPLVQAVTNDVIARLREPLQRIETLSATMIRTSKPTGGKSIKTLSTVYFARSDKFHSETISPFHRVIIADGKDLRIYVDGTPKGLLQPISKLSPEMLASVRAVPGSPESELMPLVESKAERLPAKAPFTESYSVSNKEVHVVLDLDSKGRLGRMSVTPASGQAKIVSEYSDYREVLPGTWLPCSHQSTMFVDGHETGTDHLRVEDLEINKKIPASFFNPSAFFPGVTFCSDPMHAE